MKKQKKSRKPKRQAKCWTRSAEVEVDIEYESEVDVNDVKSNGGSVEIFIKPMAKRKLDAFTDLAVGEISGLGIVTQNDGKFMIEDLFILDQECTSSTSDLTEQGVTDLVHQLIVAGEDPSLVKLWWHSHDTMQTFWSGTDEGTAAKFGNGWMISLVTNRKREYLCRLDVYHPIHLKLDNIVLKVAPEELDPGFLDMIREEIRLKVQHRGYVSGYVSRGGQGTGYNRITAGGVGCYGSGWDDWHGYNGADDHDELIKRAQDVQRDSRYGSTVPVTKNEVGFVSGSKVTKMAEIKAASKAKKEEEHAWPSSGKK